MCGILGLFNPRGLSPDPVRFRSALDRLKLRGPDDCGIWSGGQAWLGHRRLAVVDLSSAGHQPMESADGRFVIVFNGEIYNHRELRPQLDPAGGWRGTSDTETLLEAYGKWGAGCLSHINGMFALAIWDKTARTLFVARDRLGVKPLYYTQRNGEFSFASRPGALCMLNGNGSAEFDGQALRSYLELGYVPAPMSFHDGMHKLAPAHYMLISERETRIVRYWDFRAVAPDAGPLSVGEGELVEELDSLIRDAVKMRLLSDVPLGAFLSGGVDSALVVAAMAAAGGTRPKAFTIGFSEREFDEGAAAGAIAKHLGVDHVLETLGVDSLIDLLPIYVAEFDEPFADSSAFPTLAVARLARRHATVALSGDGADELFGGYHYYSLLERLKSTLGWQPFAKRLAALTLGSLPWHRGKLFCGALNCADVVTLFHYMRGVGKDYHSLIHGDVLQSTSNSSECFTEFAAAFPKQLTGAEIGMRLDLGFTLPDLFLQKVDVATMAFSLEARCPMTDYRLVEWAMRLPAQYKLRAGRTKYLLKKVLCKYLPAELVHRPKMGFGVPLASWLRGPLREWARQLIHDDTLMSKVPLDKGRVRELLRQQASGEREAHPLLWSVLMLLCFVKKYDVSRDLPEIRAKDVA